MMKMSNPLLVNEMINSDNIGSVTPIKDSKNLFMGLNGPFSDEYSYQHNHHINSVNSLKIEEEKSSINLDNTQLIKDNYNSSNKEFNSFNDNNPKKEEIKE